MSENATNPHVRQEDIAWLERTLSGAGCWLHADELLTCKGEPDTYAGKRWIRAAASQSEWIISGQDGYKHVKHATAEEIAHFVNRMQSQMDVMKTRIEAVQRNKASLN